MASRQSRRVFALLLVISTILLALLIRPFAELFLFAAVTAVAIFPAHSWLTKKVGGRQTLSAVLLVITFTLAIIVPASFAAAGLLRESVQAATQLANAVQEKGIDGIVARAPEVVRGTLEEYLHPSPEQRQRISQQLAGLGSRSVRVLGGALSSFATTAASLVVMLIAVVVFLVNGPSLIRWLEDASPLEPGQTREIFREFKSVTSSVLVANVGTGLVQSLVALLGYLLARMPQPLLATVITFFASFIPGVGGATTVVLASGVLLLTGEKWRALFLAIWGVVVVGVVDNLVKPYFVKRGMTTLNGAVVFFSLLAGIAAFGPSGFLLGPLIVVLFLTLVRIYSRDYAPAKKKQETPSTR